MQIFPPYLIERFVSINDNVRGGTSSSVMSLDTLSKGMRFSGRLNDRIGAGFTAQYYETPEIFKNFQYDKGIRLKLAQDDKDKSNTEITTYVLCLYNDIISFHENGRLKSRTVYEFSFTPNWDNKGFAIISIPFTSFIPTYRGREISRDSNSNSNSLDISNIKGLAFMVRSYFGTQRGSFSIIIQELNSYKHEKNQLFSPFFSRFSSIISRFCGRT